MTLETLVGALRSSQSVHEQDQLHSGSTMKNQPQVQVLTRDASPALDALLDEKVFGYAWLPVTAADIVPPTCTHRLYRHAVTLGHIRAERHADGRVVVFGGREYSTDIANAWRVVEKMRADGWGVGLRYEGGKSNQWVADFTRLDDDCEYSGEELAPTAPLAICRAALLTVEHPAHAQVTHCVR